MSAFRDTDGGRGTEPWQQILAFTTYCEEELVVVDACTSACFMFNSQLDFSFMIPFSLAFSCPKSLSVFILFSFCPACKSNPV